ncbi:MAG: sigma-70 family RNA polymerase sigma factor [Ruminococcaceae bacterium]|nr:sigma-70 family RNA polymerase sigma factor [Oscillospiraceae bacterium]
MEDQRIVTLYWERSEEAIVQTQIKYSNYLSGISYGILQNHEDAGECVNDTYLDAWNAMPPHRPSILSTFLGKITRRISIDRWRKRGAEKRGGGELPLALEELGQCVSGRADVEGEAERNAQILLINRFLNRLPQTERSVFLCRYWYLDSIEAISRQFGFSQSKTASMLHRTRKKLRELLTKEGW